MACGERMVGHPKKSATARQFLKIRPSMPFALSKQPRAATKPARATQRVNFG
jgi:hypothetical protein